MNFFVRVKRWSDHADRMITDSYLRSRYVLLLVILGLVVAVLFIELVRAVGPTVLDWATAHYPWALLPLTTLIVGACTYGYLTFGEFFDLESYIPEVISVVGGIAFAVALTAFWDGQIDKQSLGIKFSTSTLVLICMLCAIALTAMIALRRVTKEDLEYFAQVFLIGTLFVIIGTLPLYVIGKWVWEVVSWASLGRDVWAFAGSWWSVLLLCVAILAQISGWKRYWTDGGQRTTTSRDTPRITFGRVVTGGLTVALLAGVVLYQLPQLLISSGDLSASEYADAVTQERRTLLAVLGALGAGFTLVYTHLRHQLDRDANATGRYTEAVQQLGNADSMSIRLGGIYALARVARDSPGDTTTVTEVLAAFVRDGAKVAAGGTSLDIVAAITELGKIVGGDEGSREYYDDDDDDYDYDYDYRLINLRFTQMSQGNLESVAFPLRADLTESNFEGANLSAARLLRSVMDGSNLVGARLDHAFLENASLARVQATDASFVKTDLNFTNLKGSQLSGANLQMARMAGCNLQRANLSGADLSGADLSGADLRGAILTNAVLSDAALDSALFYEAVLNSAQLDAASAEGGTPILEDPLADEAAAKKYKAWWARSHLRRHRRFYELHEYLEEPDGHLRHLHY